MQAACRTTFEKLECLPSDDSAVLKPLDPPVLTPSRDTLQAPKLERWFTPFRVAEYTVLAGMTADIASSWGCTESNPLLRSADGRFGGRGMAVKLGITGGGVLVAHLLHRKYPQLARPLGIVLGVSGTALYGVALRNRAVGCH